MLASKATSATQYKHASDVKLKLLLVHILLIILTFWTFLTDILTYCTFEISNVRKHECFFLSLDTGRPSQLCLSPLMASFWSQER